MYVRGCYAFQQTCVIQCFSLLVLHEQVGHERIGIEEELTAARRVGMPDLQT